MFSRLAFGILVGIVAFIFLTILVVVLGMVGLGTFAGVLTPFVWGISVLLGILAFFGSTPTVWNNWRNWFN